MIKIIEIIGWIGFVIIFTIGIIGSTWSPSIKILLPEVNDKKK